jgi:hypothetical protein
MKPWLPATKVWITIAFVLTIPNVLFGILALGFGGTDFLAIAFFCPLIAVAGLLVCYKSLQNGLWITVLAFFSQWAAVVVSNFKECGQGKCTTTNPALLISGSFIGAPTNLLMLGIAGCVGIAFWLQRRTV